MATHVYTCSQCSRLGAGCICGAKRGYYLCVVCERDVEATKAVWTGEPGTSDPCHVACFTALNEATDDVSVEPVPPGPVYEFDGKTRVPEGNLQRVVEIPIHVVIQVPVTPDDCDERIKFALNDALSNIIVSYNAATFTFDPETGQIAVKNLRFEEINKSAMEQERHRKDRVTKNEN